VCERCPGANDERTPLVRRKFKKRSIRLCAPPVCFWARDAIETLPSSGMLSKTLEFIKVLRVACSLNLMQCPAAAICDACSDVDCGVGVCIGIGFWDSTIIIEWWEKSYLIA
jgi:hypothetical protein